jgi:hypothetical protein
MAKWKCTRCGHDQATCTCEDGFSDPRPEFVRQYGEEEAERFENS